MALATDGQVSQIMENWRIKEMSVDCLKEVLSDLDENEVVSMIFLLWDVDVNISIEQILNSNVKERLHEIIKIQNWQTKLVETLLITKNFNILRKLGFSKKDITELNTYFCISIHNVSKSLNRAVKSLYFLCDSLTQRQANTLIDTINKKVSQPMNHNRNNRSLEIFIISWIQHSYITITQDSTNLNSLLKDLKNLGYYSSLDPNFNFDYWKDFPEKKLTPVEPKLEGIEQGLVEVWPIEHKRLCIIINEMHFNDCEKYKTRRGSEVDAASLEKTFQGIGFEVQKKKDLYESEFMELLDSFNRSDSSYSSYGSIFMCILSHGKEGKVILSDGTDIPIKTIQNKICCKNLRKVFKFIILQSCQGEQEGSELVHDGPTSSTSTTESSPLNHVHFGLFHSTVSDFVSWRHEKDGSWFIQEICNTLQNETPLCVREWIQKVKQRVISKKSVLRKTDSDLKYAVQVPYCYEIIPNDYYLPEYVK
ncbi:hypothetical protein QAD02_006854 [Eretmocerus hayati]|uniref:Uncharacterized protein n=1 Tax=Eretmocerus hayati TaxID=131215 RepID=A0ACC2N222_9HYME|nr:hypothetical protein QAD02_006854 [Eretmocerus hayati]